MTVEETPETPAVADIPRLTAAVERILGALAPLTAEQLRIAPAADDWDGARVLAHTSEILVYWASQAQEVASRSANNLAFGRTQENLARIAAVENGAQAAPDDLRASVRTSLAKATRILRAIPPDGWHRTARHERRGEMAVSEIVRQFMLDHADEHADQAEEIALAATGAAVNR